MAIRTKLTTRDDRSPRAEPTAGERREYSEEERAKRKERVQRAKDALKRSTELKGDHVASARQALKQYLQKLNDPRQPSDEQFEALVEAPFRQPPKKREGGFNRR